MPDPLVSVLIPTLPARADLLARVSKRFRETLHDVGVEILTVEGCSWGEGLNVLAEQARGQYWSCACDDTEPSDPIWFSAARAMLDSGLTPASRYFNVAGEPLRPGTDDAPHGTPIAWCRSFLLTPAIFREVGPFLDATWWTDIQYSERLHAAGRPVTACEHYSFTHLDGPRDWLTKDEENRQRELYEEAARAAA